MGCCSKTICKGCDFANQIREFKEGLERRCAFCREPAPKSDEEAGKNIMKRIKENNDPAAMNHMGKDHFDEGDYDTALEYFMKAAELGVADAHYNLSCLYGEGQGVEKDMKKCIYHTEEAAIAGHPTARHNLGYIEANNGRFERARRHFIIAANLGYHDSLQKLKDLYALGLASKDDYEGALHTYQAAVDTMKSPEREAADAYDEAREAAR
jgi:TPR repeat protein